MVEYDIEDNYQNPVVASDSQIAKSVNVDVDSIKAVGDSIESKINTALAPKKRLLEVSEEEFHACLTVLYDLRLKKYKVGDSVSILEDIYKENVVSLVEETPVLPLILREASAFYSCM